MIPVRIPAGMKPVLANERRFVVQRDHPLAAELCPVCDESLVGTIPVSDTSLEVSGPAVVLIFAGIEPGDRKPGGWTTGGAVAVHAACAGVPESERPAES